MAHDPTGGLHYTRDLTDPVHEPGYDYTNPYKQRVGPRWVRGEIVYALPLGIIHVDPERQKSAKEYVVVYSVDGADGKPERVPGQFGIYDSKPGDPQYSPVWRYNDVVAPRDYEPNTLRSEHDCLESGYPIIEADIFTN
ncbi:MAG: hypothetical protein ACRDIY_03170 [Chloroflexota bacterium]